MDSFHLNSFSFDAATKLLNSIASSSLCTPEQDFPRSPKTTRSHIIYMDINVQHALIKVLKTFLDDKKTSPAKRCCS